MSDFTKLDHFMRTHVPKVSPTPRLRHRTLKPLAWAGIVTACISLGLYQLQRSEAKNIEVLAAIEVLDWDLSKEDPYREITEIVAIVD